MHSNSVHVFTYSSHISPPAPPTLILCCFPSVFPFFMFPFSPSVYHFLFSPSLPFSRSSLFSLVSFEVLNNERAALPVKLIGKSTLKLHGTVQRSRILSSGPRGGRERGGGGIRSTVSMRRRQWLHRALILRAVTGPHQHSMADECCDSFPENMPIYVCRSDCWTLTTVHFSTG